MLWSQSPSPHRISGASHAHQLSRSSTRNDRASDACTAREVGTPLAHQNSIIRPATPGGRQRAFTEDSHEQGMYISAQQRHLSEINQLEQLADQRPTNCEWKLGDSAKGWSGVHALAHLNPWRWSGPLAIPKAIEDLQEVRQHGNRPISLKMPAIIGQCLEFPNADEAIQYVQMTAYGQQDAMQEQAEAQERRSRSASCHSRSPSCNGRLSRPKSRPRPRHVFSGLNAKTRNSAASQPPAEDVGLQHAPRLSTSSELPPRAQLLAAHLDEATPLDFSARGSSVIDSRRSMPAATVDGADAEQIGRFPRRWLPTM